MGHFLQLRLEPGQQGDGLQSAQQDQRRQGRKDEAPFLVRHQGLGQEHRDRDPEQGGPPPPPEDRQNQDHDGQPAPELGQTADIEHGAVHPVLVAHAADDVEVEVQPDRLQGRSQGDPVQGAQDPDHGGAAQGQRPPAAPGAPAGEPRDDKGRRAELHAQVAEQAEQRARRRQPPRRGRRRPGQIQRQRQEIGGDDVGERVRRDVDQVDPDRRHAADQDRAGQACGPFAPSEADGDRDQRQEDHSAADQRRRSAGAELERPRQHEQRRKQRRHEPGADADDPFPRHQARAIDQPMRRLDRLEDLVRPDDVRLGGGGGDPQSGRQQQHAGQRKPADGPGT